jgi:D-3-phosphoglycerate dehydrogenase
MRVLIADKLAVSAADVLTAAGHDVRIDPKLKDAALREVLASWRPEILVVRSTKVGAEHLAASPALSLVVRAGAGVNTIDLGSAGEHGVFVSNCPGRNAAAVAELTFALLLGLDRQIAENVSEARAGRWDKARFSKANGVNGRVLGLLGLGRIGQSVARRAESFGMPVVAWSRSLTPETAAALGITYAESPMAVAQQCDVLSVHLALCDATRGLVGDDILAALPDGALLLNTSRAAVVDEEALLRHLDAGRVRAGLDVVTGEPSAKQGEIDHPLARHPGVYLTHHIGASTVEAQESVAAEVVRIVASFSRSGHPPNCVNLVEETSAEFCLIVRHVDRVGALASVLDLLRQEGLNVQEMSNTIFAGGGAAVARIQLHGDPRPAVHRLAELAEVLHVTCVPIERGG